MSIFNKKQLEQRLKYEEKKDNSLKKGQLKLYGWNNMSMLTQILVYIFLVFGMFSGAFISMLYASADIYVSRSIDVLGEQFRLSAIDRMESLLNKTILGC